MMESQAYLSLMLVCFLSNFDRSVSGQVGPLVTRLFIQSF